jgi:hypothetical protein
MRQACCTLALTSLISSALCCKRTMRMVAIYRAFCHNYDLQLILDTLPTCTAHTNDDDYDLGDRILDYRRPPSSEDLWPVSIIERSNETPHSNS